MPALALALLLPGNGWAAEGTQAVSTRHTDGIPEPTPLVASPGEANILRVVGLLLPRQHYLRKPFNDSLSTDFFERYLDSLDNQHIYFTQEDLAEFERYRTKLDEMTVQMGDGTPARVIFTRFRERLRQQFDYATGLLKSGPLEFKTDERYMVDRKKLPRPANLDEARRLWRDRLRFEYLQEKLNKETHSQIVSNLTRRYVRVLRNINEFDNDDVIQIYLTSLAHMYDPHSDYMGRSERENFGISMKLSLFGIGAKLQSEDGICKIVELTPASPAEKSGKLKPGDKIIAVAQGNAPAVDVIDMKLAKVVELIRGPKDSEVRLTVIPAAATDSAARKIVTLIRDVIPLEEQAAKARLYSMPGTAGPDGRARDIRLGVIDLPSFYSSDVDRRGAAESKSTTTDVKKLIRKLKEENVAGLILDLRRNGGGSLEEAINLTGLFIKEGTVVQVRDADGRVFEDVDPDPSVFYDGPLIILTSRFSASASEILAAALQDHGRALVVGDSTTHGKGTVQSLLDLRDTMRRLGLSVTNEPGALKYTIRTFYRANGNTTQKLGVNPDLVLPSVNNLLEVGEGSLENALEVKPIAPASYEKLNRVEPHLAELKRRSDRRLESDRDFAWVRTEMERYRKTQLDKSVSLNEATRLREKQEADDRAKARKRDVALRPEPADAIHEIWLKHADQPGLPPRWYQTNKTPLLTFTNATGQSIVLNRWTNYHPVAWFTNQAGAKTTAASFVLQENRISTATFTNLQGESLLFDWRGSGLPKAYQAPAGKPLTPATVAGLKDGKRIFTATREEKEEEDALAKAAREEDDEEVIDDLVPGVDITLDETRRILADYIQLLNQGPGVAVRGADAGRSRPLPK
jgi:carboxyl-terminal processing protease